MKQQINLFTPAFQRKKVNWSAASLVKLSLLTIVLIAATHAYTYYQQQQLLAKLEQLESQNNQTKNQLASVLKKAKQTSKVPTLESQLQALKKERNQSIEMLKLLRSKSYDDTPNMSVFFVGLARQTVPGIWFEKIVINNGGADLELSGQTYSADLLPRLIDQLRIEKAFSGTEFNSLLIQRQSDKANQSILDFTLRTTLAAVETSDE